ncbi:hypothetical protein [uncultured Tenacibaculum sp.]|uniref:hypothetical protein n=1 Tax=uncultured Tenacibaculum sp. TaxID=174713 RepID=UPI002636915F|nr:hypothetical protein [uncultured Tenacibaculum sp.]
MKLDINFILSFDTKDKEKAITALKDFCINTNNHTFDSDLIQPESDICFLIEEEKNTMWFKKEYDFSRAIQHKIIIGSINLSIVDYSDGTSNFDFWPPFSHGGQVCLDSKLLIDHFINLIKKVNGYSVILYQDGYYAKTLFENRILN